MKSSARSSTQAFTEIADIQDSIVLFNDGTACTILELTSVNFSLLSAGEQDAKVFAYSALLNSLSFSIQILIRSKPLQIDSYIQSLSNIIETSRDEKMKKYVAQYKDFVTSLIKTTTVLDKQFYLVISYSPLEGGATSLATSKNQKDDSAIQQAKASLTTKADSLLSQIQRLSLQARLLHKEELIKLFFDSYNQGESLSLTQNDIESPIVKGAV